MIRPVNIDENLASIQSDAAKQRAQLDGRGQLSATSRPDASESLHDAPVRLPQDQLMRLTPWSCLSIHAGLARRCNHAVITSPKSYPVELNAAEGVFYQIPADGRLNEMDARPSLAAKESAA